MPRRGLLDKTNFGALVRAVDTAYRSRANEVSVEKHGFSSSVHHTKLKGRPAEYAARALGHRQFDAVPRGSIR